MSGWPELVSDSRDGFLVHRAEWVVPMDGPPLENGALIVHGGKIAALGRWPEISRKMPSGVTLLDHGSVALIPGLINAHTHLEWSLLKGRIPFPQSGFPAWLGLIFEHRANLDEAKVELALAQGWREMAQEPVVLFADVGGSVGVRQGTPLTGAHRGDSRWEAVPVRQPFFEVLGFDVEDLERVVPVGLLHAGGNAKGRTRTALAAHALYSTAPKLTVEAKRWDDQRRRPFSIHVAEHPQEVEFIRSGTGFCRELLERIGRWNPGWSVPRMSPVEYLDRLGVLDPRTLLVHAVHLDQRDWDLVARRGSSVCFCPRSNRNLNVGRAQVDEALARGINSALGTDSLASNTDLDLFQEACWLLELYPGVAPRQVLSMITAGAARALGADRWCGTLAVGKTARFLAIDLSRDNFSSDLFVSILVNGKAGAWQWA